jgi:hypothetical protein
LKILPIAVTVSMMFLSGCLNSTNPIVFDRFASTYQNLDLGNAYTLSFYLPKDTSLNNYKDEESSKLGYSQYGFYMVNKVGRTDFFIYRLTAGIKSLEYLFGSSSDQFNDAALDGWNRKLLSSKGYDKDFYTFQSTSMKQIDGVKESRVIRTTANDQRGNHMIAESCWFEYPNRFWSMTSTWPADYYNSWFSSNLILHYK